MVEKPKDQPDKEAADLQAAIAAFQKDYEAVVEQVQSVIVGHHQVIDQTMACLLSGGHALLEGVPGLGKTLLVRTLAAALDLSFGRIQFTPDLMPSDIIGTNVIEDDRGQKTFRFQSGPIFTNLLLADEINRATPKTQSAVLEAMQEQTVSVARVTHRLEDPFFVLATQNPLEMEGTYPLPEAQLDRFMYKINVLSPQVDELVSILDRTTGVGTPEPRKVAAGSRIEQMKALVRTVPVATHVVRYVARLVLATHPQGDGAPQTVSRYVRYGCSPRAAQAIILGAKVQALREGRANVSFEDVRQAAAPAMRHRLILSFEGQADGIGCDEIVSAVIQAVPANAE